MLRPKLVETSDIPEGVSVKIFRDYHYDDRGAEKIQETLCSLTGTRRVVVNLEEVDIILSDLMAILMEFEKAQRDCGCLLVLCCLGNDTKELFAFTNMNKRFIITESAEEALYAQAQRS